MVSWESVFKRGLRFLEGSGKKVKKLPRKNLRGQSLKVKKAHRDHKKLLLSLKVKSDREVDFGKKHIGLDLLKVGFDFEKHPNQDPQKVILKKEKSTDREK